MWEFRKKVLRTFDSNKKGQGTTGWSRTNLDRSIRGPGSPWNPEKGRRGSMEPLIPKMMCAVSEGTGCRCSSSYDFKDQGNGFCFVFRSRLSERIFRQEIQWDTA